MGEGTGIARKLGALVGLQQDAANERHVLVEERLLQRIVVENKPPSEYSGRKIQNILRLANIADEAGLTDILGELAKTPAKRH